jgi:hypothetical protein
MTTKYSYLMPGDTSSVLDRKADSEDFTVQAASVLLITMSARALLMKSHSVKTKSH